MRWLNNQVRFGMAAVVVCGGAAYGAHLYQDQPAADASQAKQIRQLAERLRTQEPAARPSLSPAPVTAVRPILVSAEDKPQVRVQPAVTVAKTTAPTSSPPASSEPIAPVAPADPVKNIALMGVTHQGEAGQAWLVDLESHTREVVGEGEEAFGFTIKEIDDESVLLARGTETFNLRLGEKSIPTAAPAATETTETASGSGNGWGGPGGGDNRGDRRARFAAMMSQMGGGRSWGGRSWGGSSGNWGGRSNNNSGSRWSSNSGGRSFGGFSGGFGGNFGNFGGRNNQNANLNRPTSNPQEARRRKSRLVGGADAIDEPAAFNNPQTLRRLGSASGQAFGTGNNGNNRNNQNNRR